jgi:hypothetical protein
MGPVDAIEESVEDTTTRQPEPSGSRASSRRQVWEAPDVGGFVVFDDDRAWAASNAAWRATVPPAADALPQGSDARLLVEHASRGGLHYLDLSRALPSDRALIKGALAEICNQYLAGVRNGATPRTGTVPTPLQRTP